MPAAAVIRRPKARQTKLLIGGKWVSSQSGRTFEDVDPGTEIVVLEGGRISMTGRHEELLRREGLYRELCAMQFQADPQPEVGVAPAANPG